MKCVVIYASVTGNTGKIARAIHAMLPQGSPLLAADQAADLEAYDVLFLGYWVDRGTADAQMRAVIDGLSNKKIALFGTLGAYPHSRHALETQLKVWELAAQNNQVLGSCICQGAVSPELIGRFQTLPPDHPHAVDEARRLRYREAAQHPDGLDERNAGEFARKILAALAVMQ